MEAPVEPGQADRPLSPPRAPRDLARPPVALTGAETARLIVALFVASLSLGFGTGAFSGVTIGIGRLFHASAGQLNWVISVPLLATVVCAPIVGRLGDVFGHRRLLVLSVGGTALGGVLAAVAPSFGILLLGRLLQGLIGGVFGLGPAIMRDRLSARRGHVAIAALSAAASLGIVAGLLCAAGFGGQHDGTRIVLWSSAAIFVAATMGCMIAPDSVTRVAARVDWRGAVVLAAGLACVSLGLRQAPTAGWSDAATLAYLAVGSAVLIAWVPVEARTRQPFIDVRRVASRGQLAPCAIAFIFGVGAFGAQTAAITFMASPGKAVGYGLSMPLTDVAAWLVPCAIASAACALLAARLAAVIGSRVVFVSGGVLLTAGFALMIAWHQATAPFVLALLVQYAGLGVSLAMVPVVLSELAGPGERGVVASLGESLRGLGGGLSTAVFATLEGSLVIAHTTVPTVDAYLWVWGTCGLVAAASIPLALIVPRAGTAVSGKLAGHPASVPD
ncbi:MAG TPA: MFS transporter [Trebonia sp.]|nr:MFS transporter [Trebonia sp.]